MKTLSTYIFLFLVALPVALTAQQHPQISHYMQYRYLINPALAGNTGHTNINFTAKQQYTGFTSAPRTFILAADTRLFEEIHILRHRRVEKSSNKASRTTNIGLGGYIFNDRNGIISRTGLQMSYAYHINFDNQYQLSFGLSITGYQFKLDDGSAVYLDQDDPLLNGSKKTFFIPDADAGIYLSGNGLYGGITVTDLFGSGIKLGANNFQDYQTLRHFNLLGGYKWALSRTLILEPSFLGRITSNAYVFDISSRLFYQRDYWVGLTYRTSNNLVVMAGISLDGLYLGYAYGAGMGAISTYGGGSHEIMVGTRLGGNNTSRRRWLRPDISEVGE